jgi:hypothetical protein
MANSVLAAIEATHGTAPQAGWVSIPCAFTCQPTDEPILREEVRNSQDVHWVILPGPRGETWEVADSALYHDTMGYWLSAALGNPDSQLVNGETAVWDNIFKLADDPLSLALRVDQARRSTEPLELTYAVVDKLTLKFAADGELTYSLSGLSMPEEPMTSSPTYSFASTKPFAVWQGTVQWGGTEYTKLISGEISLSRNRKARRVLNGSRTPYDFVCGNRTVDAKITVDFATADELQAFRAATTNSLTLTFEDQDNVIGAQAHPKLTVKIGTLAWTKAERDTGAELPELNLEGRALYNGTDASLMVVTLRTTVNLEQS